METFLDICLIVVGATGLVGFCLLTYTPKKDGRTKTGYKNNASPWAIKRRFIGAVLFVIAYLLYLLFPDDYLNDRDSYLKDRDKPAERPPREQQG